MRTFPLYLLAFSLLPGCCLLTACRSTPSHLADSPALGLPAPNGLAFRGTYVITDYGARSDSTTLNTKAINQAIQVCYQNGGGKVVVPPGVYVTGTLVLRSNVNLQLEAGAVLLGSKDTSDYLSMGSTLFQEGYNRYGMIYASQASNIAITGLGQINGRGSYFMNGLDKPHMGRDWDRRYTRQGDAYMPAGTIFEDGPVSYAYRPGMLITLERCQNVKVLDVSLLDTPEWTIRLEDSEDAQFSRLRIQTNPLVPNSDGIHVTSSRNVLISDCNIATGDDAIIVTGFGTGPKPGQAISPDRTGNKTGYAENVVVSNCTLSSRSACIRVGYGTHPIRNLVFSNLVMYASNRGIGVFARDSSQIDNVVFANIIIVNRLHSGHWWGKGEPIHLSALRESEQGPAGKISNIRFSNITAQSETGILVYGTKESRIEHLSFRNVQLSVRRGKYTDSYGGNFDLRPAASKAEALFKHDIPAFYAQYVKDLSLEGFEVEWGDGLPDFFTHALEVDHFDGLQLSGFQGVASPGAKGVKAVRLTNGVKSQVRLPAGITVEQKNVQ